MTQLLMLLIAALCLTSLAELALLVLTIHSLYHHRMNSLNAFAQPPSSSADTSHEASTKSSSTDTHPQSSVDEQEAKRRYEAEEKAFQELMNYSADVAYGLTRNEEQ